jgi:hypothetical protein
MQLLHLPYLPTQTLPSFLVDDFGDLCQITRFELETPVFSASVSTPIVSRDTFEHVYRKQGE